MNFRVFITRPVPQPVVDMLESQCEVRVRPHDSYMPTAELIAECRDVEAILMIGSRVKEEFLAETRNLKVIANPSVGYDNVDLEACTRRGIAVTNVPGGPEETVADLAFALMLAVARRVLEGDRLIRAGGWREWQWMLLYGTDVHGKTLGILGLGRIGRAVARRARGFSMRVLYHDRARLPEEIERELGVEFVDRETLLRESDFVSLHVPLTPETRHSVTARDFQLMKPTAFFINTARGAVVDESALVDALVKQKIAGAGLDVFEKEPHVPAPLLERSNVVLMPHLGSATAETRLKIALIAAENILDVLHGRRARNIVNPEIYQ